MSELRERMREELERAYIIGHDEGRNGDPCEIPKFNAILALLDSSEPVGFAPYMEDEDIPTPAGGLLYEGETGRLIAYRTEQQARDSMVHGTALPLFASPTPTPAPEGGEG